MAPCESRMKYEGAKEEGRVALLAGSEACFLEISAPAHEDRMGFQEEIHFCGAVWGKEEEKPANYLNLHLEVLGTS